MARFFSLFILSVDLYLKSLSICNRDAYNRAEVEIGKWKSGDGVSDVHERERNQYKFAEHLEYLQKNRGHSGYVCIW